MPRHRKECVPKHRAQRRGDRPGRGVRISAAFSRRGGRSMRGLLVTPWFAAGVGILIAAALALATPRHAVLSYGPVNPGIPCKLPGCASPALRPRPGSLASAKAGIQLRLPVIRRAPAGTTAVAVWPSATPRPASPAEIAVRYAVIRHGRGTFLAVITVQSSRRLGDWTL